MRAIVMRMALVWLVLAAFAVPARADCTLFFGVTPPEFRPTIGFAFGRLGDSAGGFELEWARRTVRAGEPEFGSFGVNVLVRLPIRAGGARFYASAGLGISDASGDAGHTNIGVAARVDVKRAFQLRVDYRVFRFPDEGRNEGVGLHPHRLSVGLTFPW